MIDTYWDFYIVYIDKCVRENYANDIDPGHYRMEWNHFLPQCIFGDQPVGHWLTLKQHAIASALQTLGLRENCMTGMMKEYLPEKLLELAWPYYCLAASEKMKLRTGELHPMFGRKRPDQSERMKLQTGELNPMFGRTGELNPMFGTKNPALAERNRTQIRAGELAPMYGKTGELSPLFGRKWWVNSEGETYRGFEAPGPEWQNGRKWRFTL